MEEGEEDQNIRLQDFPNEILMNIGYNLPYDELLDYCGHNKRFEQICQSEYFWRNKLLKDYPDVQLDESQNYDYYISLYQKLGKAGNIYLNGDKIQEAKHVTELITMAGSENTIGIQYLNVYNEYCSYDLATGKITKAAVDLKNVGLTDKYYFMLYSDGKKLKVLDWERKITGFYLRPEAYTIRN
jgi:hypothetical protein